MFNKLQVMLTSDRASDHANMTSGLPGADARSGLMSGHKDRSNLLVMHLLIRPGPCIGPFAPLAPWND